MICRECGGKLGVVDVRRVNNIVARKRVCKNCNNTIYTREIVKGGHEAFKYAAKIGRFKFQEANT